FVSGRSVLDPRLWLDGWSAADPLVKRFLTIAGNWWAQVRAAWSPLTALLIFGETVAGLLGGFLAFRMLNWLIRPRQDKSNPTDLERLWNIFARVIIAIAALLIPIILIHVALLETVDASQQAERIYWTFATCLL